MRREVVSVRSGFAPPLCGAWYTGGRSSGVLSRESPVVGSIVFVGLFCVGRNVVNVQWGRPSRLRWGFISVVSTYCLSKAERMSWQADVLVNFSVQVLLVVMLA